MKLLLQQKLTLSHLLVTVLTSIMLIIFMGAAYWVYVQSNIAAKWLGDLSSEIADDLSYYLDGDPLYKRTARDFIREIEFVALLDQDENEDDFFEYFDDRMIIADVGGNILASNDQTRWKPGESLFSLAELPASFNEVKIYNFVEEVDHIGVAPIHDLQDSHIGWIYVRMADQGGYFFSEEARATIVLGIFSSLVIAVIISSMVGSRLAKTFSVRLSRLQLVSRAFSLGDLSQRLQLQGEDEITLLADQFNKMADKVSDQMKDLTSLADKNALLAEEASGLARSEERNRMARELHDAVKQQIFGLSLTAGTIKQLAKKKDKGLINKLGELEEQASKIHAEMDHIIKQLRPVSLQGKGLSQALRDHVEDWEITSQIPLDLKIKNSREIPVAMEHALIRISQEALNNIEKHSNASKASIDLNYLKHKINLKIEDDGSGLAQKEFRSKGFGLASMRERTEELGGTFEMKSLENKGLRISVSIPIKGNETSD